MLITNTLQPFLLLAFLFTISNTDNNGYKLKVNKQNVFAAKAITHPDAFQFLPDTFLVCNPIGVGTHDAEEYENGVVSLNNGDLELCYDSFNSPTHGVLGNQTIGLRFADMAIPKNATIVNAHLQFTVDETSNLNPCNLNIYGEASANALEFSYNTNDISLRTPTVAQAAWLPPDWTSTGGSGPDQQSPDLAVVIQELVHQTEWTAASPVVLILQGPGRRVAESFDGAQADAPVLCIEYSFTCLDPGTACNDFDPNTYNDVEDGNCNCAGTFIPLCEDMNFKIAPVSLAINNYTDTIFPDAEPAYAYNFVKPVNADIFAENPEDYIPLADLSNRYEMSAFGPRHKSTSVPSSNIPHFDFHQGTDISSEVTFGGNTYDSNNPPPINCMCTGIIDEIVDGDDAVLELTEVGRYVTVKCNTIFNANPDWENIYIAYRHLDTITMTQLPGDTITMGEQIGIMGASGQTSTVHLHMSVIRRNTGSRINVHPMRIFDPTAATHLLKPLEHAEITQLGYGDCSALFRIAIPQNEANLRAITVKLAGTDYERIYDYEEISKLSAGERDKNNYIEGLEVFAYPLNRGQKAYRRAFDRYQEGRLPTVYPASPDALDSAYFFPFLSEGLYRTPAYVLDLRVNRLPPGYDINGLKIDLVDIYGHALMVNGVTNTEPENFAWSYIRSESDDAEEYEDGTMLLDDGDLELAYDNNTTGTQKIGLRFTDVKIPPGALITKAYLQFRANSSDADNAALYLQLENSNNAQTYSNLTNDISDRATGSITSFWNPSAWITNEMCPAQRWDDLALPLQELVDSAGWSVNSSLAFILSGTGTRDAEGFDLDDLWRNAYIYIEYSENQLCGPDSLLIVNTGFAGATSHQADITVITSDSVVVQPGANVLYTGGTEILLNAGFEVEQGAEFEGRIEGCDLIRN